MFDALLTSAPWWAWLGFHALVFLMLGLDLGVFSRRIHAPSFKEAAAWSTVWIVLALVFNAVVFRLMGMDHGLKWFTGYVLEKSLSVDNLFVFVLLFTAFGVELKHQHRILYWGVLGALLMRAVMILAGTALLHRFEWMVYVFGGFLLVTGIKMLVLPEKPSDPSQNLMTRWFKRLVPFDPEGGHHHFLVRKDGRTLATPMLLVLVTVEITDLVFAVDSIPAVLAVTTDPFTVYTSNVFAILGLRSLYFLLAKSMDRFHRLKTGLAVVLAFVGVKMLLSPFYKIPIVVSLVLITAVLAGSVISSLAWPQEHPPDE